MTVEDKVTVGEYTYAVLLVMEDHTSVATSPSGNQTQAGYILVRAKGEEKGKLKIVKQSSI